MAAGSPLEQAGQPVQIDLSDVGIVSPLAKSVRAKWDSAEAEASRDHSLDSLLARLTAADEKRQGYLDLRRKAHKRSRSRGEPVDADDLKTSRSQELEDKLATATAVRQQTLEDRRSKAAATLLRTSQVLERLTQRQKERADRLTTTLSAARERREAMARSEAERLEAQHALASTRRAKLQDHWCTAAEALTARLQQAAHAREAQLGALAARAGEQVAHAKAVTAAVRAAEESATAARAEALERRMARAELARLESMQAVVNSLPQTSGEAFLVRRARMRTRLLRQASSRKLQRFWRAFCRERLTTAELAARFIDTGVPNPPPAPLADTLPDVPPPVNTSARSGSLAAPLPMGYVPVRGNTPANSPTASPTRSRPAVAVMGPRTGILEGDQIKQAPRDAFERFAAAMSAPATLRAGHVLLRRFAAKREAACARAPPGATTDVTPLLKRLATRSPTKPNSSPPPPLERYPLRVFMCAFMILKHPEVVFSKQGDRESSLVATAKDMVTAFEAVLHRLVAPALGGISRQNSAGMSSEISGSTGSEEGRAVGELLAAWDAAWVPYLEQFVAWKCADAATLESELIRMAAEFESSMLTKTGPEGAASQRVTQSADLQALVEQMRRDHALLRTRIERLGGPSGTARLEAALAAARAAASNSSTPAAGSPMTSPRRPSSASRQPANAAASPVGSPMKEAGHAAALHTGAAGDASSIAAASNETLMWELLYNLDWQMPMAELESLWTDALGQSDVMTEDPTPPEGAEPSEIAAAVHARVRRIAERVMWDHVSMDLMTRLTSSSQVTEAESAPHMLAALLSELGSEIADALPEQAARAAHQLRSQLDLQGLQAALQSHQGTGLASLNLPQLMDSLRSLSLALQALGSPAREGPAKTAHAALQQDIMAVVAANDAPTFAKVVTKALALLRVQARMLRLDLANVRLHMLANTLRDGSGTRYAHDKFLAAHGLTANSSTSDLAAALPLARAWLALSSGLLPSLDPALTKPPPAAPQQTGSNIPAHLRSGLGSASRTASAATTGSSGPAPAAQLLQGVSSHSWRGMVRIGLVQLVAGDTPVGPHSVAETLAMDAGRLHSAQNSFQNAVVLATCLLLVHQARRGAPRSAADVAGLKRRLAALLADPSVRLPDLATELARMGQTDGMDPAPESCKAMESALGSMLVRSSGGFKAVSSAISTALITRLLGGSGASILPALARAGAGVLSEEVEALANRLTEVAAIGEAVHGGLYEQLSFDLL